MEVIKYSAEHIHVLAIDGERCYLSRNWNRCTAKPAARKWVGGEEAEVGVTAYYDGKSWRFWNGQEFVPRIEGEDGSVYIELPDGSFF